QAPMTTLLDRVSTVVRTLSVRLVISLCNSDAAGCRAIRAGKLAIHSAASAVVAAMKVRCGLDSAKSLAHVDTVLSTTQASSLAYGWNGSGNERPFGAGPPPADRRTCLVTKSWRSEIR